MIDQRQNADILSPEPPPGKETFIKGVLKYYGIKWGVGPKILNLLLQMIWTEKEKSHLDDELSQEFQNHIHEICKR